MDTQIHHCRTNCTQECGFTIPGKSPARQVPPQGTLFVTWVLLERLQGSQEDTLDVSLRSICSLFSSRRFWHQGGGDGGGEVLALLPTRLPAAQGFSAGLWSYMSVCLAQRQQNLVLSNVLIIFSIDEMVISF